MLTCASHIRVGTFQWVAGQDDEALLRRPMLRWPAMSAPAVDGTAAPATSPQPRHLRCHLPGHAGRRATPGPAGGAQWMAGSSTAMNTDNMTLSGETIDYGPCAFMEARPRQRSAPSTGRATGQPVPGIAQ